MNEEKEKSQDGKREKKDGERRREKDYDEVRVESTNLERRQSGEKRKVEKWR